MTDQSDNAIVQQHKFVPGAPLGSQANLRGLMDREDLRDRIIQTFPASSDEEKEQRLSRLVTQAQLAVAANNMIGQCTQLSIVESLMAAAETGLSLSKQSGEGYLVPYKNVCTFMPGYRGFIRLITQTGMVSSVQAECVYKGEVFVPTRGTNPDIRHEINIDVDRSDENIEAVYAVAFVRGGPPQFVVLNREEIARVRKASRAKKGPWDWWFAEMAKKTAVRRLAKMLPQTVYNESQAILERAMEFDNRAAGIIDMNTEKHDELRQEYRESRTQALLGESENEQDQTEPGAAETRPGVSPGRGGEQADGVQNPAADQGDSETSGGKLPLGHQGPASIPD